MTVYDLPRIVNYFLGLCPFCFTKPVGAAHTFEASKPEGRRPSAHQTAEPRNDVLRLAFNLSFLNVMAITSVPDLKPIVY